jgi:hypothetical protein
VDANAVLGKDGMVDGPSNEWSSWSAWLRDATDLAQRAAGVAGRIQSDWEESSRQDKPWTTDTIMNEVVNSWERFTPVLGEMVQHWVDGTSQALRETWPEAGSDLADLTTALDDTAMGQAMSPYADVTRDAADRMVRGDYRSADAVETFAVLGGMWAKDTWRLVADVRDGMRGTDGPADESRPRES